jgi:hypothetical protein
VGIRGKRGEIARALQQRRRFPHRGEIQRRADVDGLVPVQRRHDRRVPDVEAVFLALRVVARVESRTRAAQFRHAHGLGQQGVQAFLQLPGFPRALEVEVRHLRPRMDAGVRAAAGMHAHGFARQLLQRRLQRALHRRLVRLRLPAEEFRPVVGDGRAVAPPAGRRRLARRGAPGRHGTHGSSPAPVASR